MTASLEARSLSRALSIRGEIRVLLDDVSFRLESGQVLGVTGPSGAGKSVLLRVLMGLVARSGGDVLLDGRTVEPRGLPAFRRAVACVPQDPAGAAETVRETWARVRSLRVRRDRSGLPPDAPLAHFDGLGLERKMFDQPWEQASGGERRRLHLCLAASLEPRFLVLDEPSGGLDRASAYRLSEWIRERAAGGTGLLVVSHEETLLATTADRILVLYDGRVHGEGTPQELIPAAVAAAREEGA